MPAKVGHVNSQRSCHHGLLRPVISHGWTMRQYSCSLHVHRHGARWEGLSGPLSLNSAKVIGQVSSTPEVPSAKFSNLIVHGLPGLHSLLCSLASASRFGSFELEVRTLMAIMPIIMGVESFNASRVTMGSHTRCRAAQPAVLCACEPPG